ncbi:AT-rich interactive domain-containing protein 4A isoform X2 [Dunckerocampus dactyliophorus]|uniref:AT-rich interactive domain-containing protein 4A isoform X2 n=1 Tax=Dunckerocampus dactyliophorus TaxID=161453 RepID=UPI0024071D13|nr:AT-rich interactive domain-containing protein 4A isoform X2 [Dunckerocampus dactyliophorus]
MKAADEPAYLTVGTDVSAKYRGAFCEAKIKTVKRLVKVKVTLKGESASQVVHDDQVKGPLRVGSTVEVKTNEGLCSEAVIGKLTDASLYTVVFDDGDEKTLRRTSLCLKGERHFAESETLDQLPLTNPEHFGTPVIGKKSNRGGRRASQAVADEENESSSSEDDEEDRRRLNDELLGKVCSIKTDNEPASWFLALVVSPSCHDELVVKKDQCLVRSFSDCKFHTVARRHVHPLNSININKSELSNTHGFAAAQMFARRREIPDVWKMDMSQILDSSSSDDDGDHEEQKQSEEDELDEEEKRKKLMKEEPEEEPDPEERDHFLQQLYKFMEDRGTPINKPPVLGYKDLNLFKLFRLVYQHGGCRKIESGTVWKQVYMDLGIPVLNSAASYNVKTAYRKYLYGFEEYCRSACITFRTIHHNNPRLPKAQIIPRTMRAELGLPTLKVEPAEDKGMQVEPESESDKEELKERQPSPRGRRRCGGVATKMDMPARPDKAAEENSDEPREARRRSNRHLDESERGSEEDDEEEDDEGEEEEEEEDDDDEDDDDDDEEEEEEELEEEEENEHERRRADRSEEDDEDNGDSVTGTKVRVKYGRGKTQKIYEAHIKKTDMDNGEHFYLVHYYGWNVRYDEWVKADRIIWPTEKGARKRSRKKNKEEVDEDKAIMAPAMKPMGAKRGRPQIRTTPTSTARRKTPSNEGHANGKGIRTDPNMANGDNVSRGRRTRRTSGMYDSDPASNEDSGNSSVDSESEEPPDKKLSPWQGRPINAGHQEEEPEVKEEEEEEEMTSQPPVTLPCPSMPQEDVTKVVSQPEGVEQPAEKAVPLDEHMYVAQEVLPKAPSAAQEVPAHLSPKPEKPLDVPPPPPEDTEMEDVKSCPLSPPRLKVHRINADTPPRISLCTSIPAPPSPATAQAPPRSILKRPDEPMVVLHCLPTQRLPPEPPAASDTDSASEEEEEEDKKLRPDRKQEEVSPSSPKPSATPPKMTTGISPRSLPSPLRGTEAGKSDQVTTKEEEEEEEGRWQVGTPPQSPNALGPAPSEEPQMDPEALVCHEVDLDDPDEKEKPAPSLETSLPPFLHVAVSSSVHCPEEFHTANSLEQEVAGITSREEEVEEEEEEDDDDDDDAHLSPNFDASQETRGQKRVTECTVSPSAKKQKRNHKRVTTPAKVDKNGTGHSSDSEDQSRLSSLSKRKSPTPHSKDKHSSASPQRTYKWTFQLGELDSMTSSERISFLQEKLQELRKYYMSLKSEVASIDRRRKRLKKKEREVSVSNTTASTSSGSSDTGMSPSSASPTQNTVAVECR